jgi:hypothetical protein
MSGFVHTIKPWKFYTATFTHPATDQSYSIGGIMEGIHDQFQRNRARGMLDWHNFYECTLPMERPARLNTYMETAHGLPGGADSISISWELQEGTQSVMSAPAFTPDCK